MYIKHTLSLRNISESLIRVVPPPPAKEPFGSRRSLRPFIIQLSQVILPRLIECFEEIHTEVVFNCPFINPIPKLDEVGNIVPGPIPTLAPTRPTRFKNNANVGLDATEDLADFE